jgi:hypothetical protein
MPSKRLVEYTRPNLMNVADLFVLKPGINEVPEDLWQKAQKVELVRLMVDEDILKPGEGPAPVDLSTLKPAAAVTLVKKTVDRELLERWFDAEKRKPVLEAIQAQVEAITPDKTKKGEKPDGADGDAGDEGGDE